MINEMDYAIEEAKLAAKLKDGPPFGAVICKTNNRNLSQIIATGHNETIKLKDPTAHAEIIAIRKACKIMKRPNLEDCVLYASAEPCPMCIAASVASGIKMIYFGAKLDDYPKILEKESRVAALEKIRDPEFRSTYMVQLMRHEACQVFSM